jgi:hypothetical protein
MPSPAELAANAVMLGMMFAGVRYLRDAQPDPNPAIEAREAAAEAAKLAAEALTAGLGTPPVMAAVEDRREQVLPFVGTDRRVAQLAEDAAAWRRSA